MVASDNRLSETDIRSPDSHTTVVRADASETRPWAVKAPVCPLLKQFFIAHLGVGDMPSPFEIVRNRLGGRYFLASLDGQGRVLVDGRWKSCSPGQAFMLPPGTRHAFHTAPGGRWRFCWVRYRATDTRTPPDSSTPVLAEFDGRELERAILGLHDELKCESSPAAVDLWVRLVEHYVNQFAGQQRVDPRLVELWQTVESNLAAAWSSDEMAARIGLSEKQLERLCRRHLGRTPRQQLIWLRMRRAADLIASRDDTIESIAHAVGYQNPFVFSRTFRRCMGWPPSEYAQMQPRTPQGEREYDSI